MKGLQCFLIFLGMMILFPASFGVAYLVWQMHPFVALVVLFLGLSTVLLGGFETLDRALSHP